MLAEKINKNERKNNAEIIIEEFGEESKDFRDLLDMNYSFDSSVDIQASSMSYKICIKLYIWWKLGNNCY